MWKRSFFLLVLLGSPAVAASAAGQTYWQDGACAEIDLGASARLNWCVETVVALPSGHLELLTRWQTSGLSGGTLDKASDTGNKKMYLVDNLGNRYDHIETRGAAAEGGRLSDEHSTLRGVFVFPRAQSGATEFTFHDDDNHIAIPDITTSESARSDRTTNASVLGRVMQTVAIDIDYSWSGLRGQLQETYSLRSTDDGFQAKGVRDEGAPMTLPQSVIPSSEIESFLATLAQAPLVARKYVPNITHTDDYPSIKIELRTSRDAIVFFTQSQGTDHIPWGVESGGKVYVVPDATPARALQMLDPFFGRDLASRALKFLAPYVGEERAREVWSELEEELGTEDAYKTAFRLKDLLGGEQDDEVWAALDRFLEERKAPPPPAEPVESAVLPDGDSAFVRAARDGDVEKLGLLLGRGVDPNERSELDGHTALIAAATGNHAAAVRVLLASGADASVRSRTGETALTLAASGDHVEGVKALLEGDIDKNVKGRDGKTALMQAAENGRTDVVAALLLSGAEVDARSLRGGAALGFAAANHHPAVVSLLLRAGAEPNLQDRSGDTPLMATMHPGIARALIRAGANVNARDDQGLTPAMRLSAGGGPGSRFGDTSRSGGGADRVGTLQALLTAGADVDARDSQGRTALIWATTGATGREGHPELLPLLIEAGANVDAADAKGGTAIVYAAIHGHVESARILIAAGADVNVQMGRSTPLNFALDHEHAELVRLLLRSGARR